MIFLRVSMAGEHVTQSELKRTEDHLLLHIDSKFDVIVTQIKNHNKNIENHGLRQDKIIDTLINNQSETIQTLAIHKTYWKLSGAVMLAVLSGFVALTVAVLS